MENSMPTKEQVEELKLLKDTAKRAGLTFANNAGLDTMRKLVRAELAIKDEGNASLVEEAGDISLENKQLAKLDPESMEARALKARINMPILPSFQTRAKQQQESRNRCAKQVRIIVHCNNPLKKSWQGEIVTASNALGTWKKYIPFDVEWHAPQIVVNAMKEQKYSFFYSKKSFLGMTVRKAKLKPSYNIETLEPLTKEEVAELAKLQKVTQAQSED
jgi:hypothetical protein